MSKKRKNPYPLNKEQKQYVRDYTMRIAEQAKSKITEQVAEIAVIALGVAAYDEIGLAGADLKAFVEKFLNQFDCIVAGTVSLDDLKEILKNEADCEFNAIRNVS
jgi:hypothetical protein